MWTFDQHSYGPLWKSYEKEGFGDTEVIVSGADGTFTFRYGDLLAGHGQWVHGDEPDRFVGRSQVTSVLDVATQGNATEQVVQLLDGDELLEVTYTVLSGSVKGVKVTEYFERVDVEWDEAAADADIVSATGAA